jgi:glycosyltransferase involved in cell wall biosynthesis
MESVGAFVVNAMVGLGHEVMLIHYDHNEPCYPIDSRVRIVPGLGEEGFLCAVKDFDPHIYFIMSSGSMVIELVSQAQKINAPIALQECTNHARYCGLNWSTPRKISINRAYWERELINSAAVRIRHVLPHSVESHPDYIKTKVKIFPNACHFKKNSIGTNILKREKLILNIGGLRKVKNIKPILEGFKQFTTIHEDWKLMICGSGYRCEQVYQDEILTFITENGLSEKIILTGEIRNIIEMYNRSRIHIIGSVVENFGMCIVEAFHQGVPTIAFDNSFGASSLVEHEVNGLLVDQADGSDGIAEALFRLASDEELLVKLGSTAQEDNRFLPETVVADWESFFYECAQYKDQSNLLLEEQMRISPERAMHARSALRKLLTQLG